MSEPREPRITINGVLLTIGQAMTVRVAIESFSTSLQEGLGDDDMGQSITAGYQARIEDIRKVMY